LIATADETNFNRHGSDSSQITDHKQNSDFRLQPEIHGPLPV